MLSNFKKDENITIQGFIESLVEKKTKKQKAYTQLTLSKGGKSTRCFIWDTSLKNTNLKQNDVIEVSGIVNIYNDFRSLHVSEFRKIEITEELQDELLPHLPAEEIDAYKLEINKLVEMVEDKDYRKILVSLLKKYKKEIFIAPAAQKVHEACVAGLIKHTSNVAAIALEVGKIYATAVDVSLLITASILHDIGKIHTYIFNEFAIEFTKKGFMMDHLVIGIEMISDIIKEKNIPISEEKLLLLKHCILSHHGKKEYGSPVCPAIPEALILHYSDMVDSQLSIMLDGIDELKSGETSKDRNYFIGNYIYRKRQQ